MDRRRSGKNQGICTAWKKGSFEGDTEFERLAFGLNDAVQLCWPLENKR